MQGFSSTSPIWTRALLEDAKQWLEGITLEIVSLLKSHKNRSKRERPMPAPNNGMTPEERGSSSNPFDDRAETIALDPIGKGDFRSKRVKSFNNTYTLLELREEKRSTATATTSCSSSSEVFLRLEPEALLELLQQCTSSAIKASIKNPTLQEPAYDSVCRVELPCAEAASHLVMFAREAWRAGVSSGCGVLI